MSINNTAKQIIKEYGKEGALFFVDNVFINHPDPQVKVIGIGLKTFISFLFGVTERKTKELDEFFKENSQYLTTELILSDEFRSGLASFLKDYYTEINDKKRKQALIIFLGFINSSDKQNWEMSRRMNTLSLMSPECLEFLCFIKKNISESLVNTDSPHLTDRLNAYFGENAGTELTHKWSSKSRELIYELISLNLVNMMSFKIIWAGSTADLNARFTAFGIEFIQILHSESEAITTI